MPLLEVVGNGVSVVPEQIGAIAVNVGVTLEVTVRVKVVVVAHCPGSGVNVYVVVVVLSSAGAHVPVMPLLEVVGSGARVAPEHIGATAVKAGVVLLFTVMVKVVVVAHCPGSGVNVYVVVVVLSKAGDQFPIIPLLEVVGSGVNVAPEHIGATAVKVGIVLLFTVIVNVVVVAHWPTVGVNV